VKPRPDHCQAESASVADYEGNGFPRRRSLQYLAMPSSPQPDPITDLLKRSKTIAVVGLSNSPLRPSHGVSAYMQTNGYRIIPVNPEIKGALGEKAYASLLDVPEKIDIVDIFRRPEFVEEVVDQAIQLKVPAIWMQEEVINEKAAEKARQAGIFVVMDHCILKEHKARFG
jgi:predicted CoA-binding protein